MSDNTTIMSDKISIMSDNISLMTEIISEPSWQFGGGEVPKK